MQCAILSPVTFSAVLYYSTLSEWHHLEEGGRERKTERKEDITANRICVLIFFTTLVRIISFYEVLSEILVFA